MRSCSAVGKKKARNEEKWRLRQYDLNRRVGQKSILKLVDFVELSHVIVETQTCWSGDAKIKQQVLKIDLIRRFKTLAR